MRRLVVSLISACLLSFSPVSHGHKVIFDVFASAGVMEGELGFSNGDMAVNARIEVFDQSGALIGSVDTDAEGFFIYTPSKGVDHYFRADLGAGHVGEVMVSATEFAQDAGLSVEASLLPASPTAVTEVGQASDVAAKDLAKLSAEVRQLRKELRAYKDSNDLQSILGGIGYIVGIFGLLFYLAARRKLEHK